MGTKVKYLQVVAPYAVFLPRKKTKDKRCSINMNWYRNADKFTSNDAKVLYKDIVSDQLNGVELETPVKVTYQVYKPTRVRLDKMNVAAVTAKFLLDAMTELGVWPDDNDDYVKDELILPTIHDKHAMFNNVKGKVVVTFETIEEK